MKENLPPCPLLRRLPAACASLLPPPSTDFFLLDSSTSGQLRNFTVRFPIDIDTAPRRGFLRLEATRR